jgi:hypothetical protein
LILAKRGQRAAKSLGVAIDDGNAKVGFRREVVVDAGLADAERVGDVLVAEGAVAARLNQRLGHVEDLFGRRRYRFCVRRRRADPSHRTASRWPRLTQYTAPFADFRLR